MNVRPFWGRALRSGALCSLVALAAGVELLACSDSDLDDGIDPQAKKFCEDLLASPAFSCCSDADRRERQFSVRHGYGSASECAQQLTNAAAESQGRRAFDSTAADSCLSHLAARTCGAPMSTPAHVDEEKAGCARVIGGKQDEGQSCITHQDCKPGLVCPPTKETGASYCSRPGGSGQACLGGDTTTALDHPACQPGLVCTLIGENPAGCPSPPCLLHQCVPLSEEGEPCKSFECADGLSCRDGLCSKGRPSSAGGPCSFFEQCADGLYCDASVGQCVPRKSAGTACSPASSAFECKGLCKAAGDGTAVCMDFCSSG